MPGHRQQAAANAAPFREPISKAITDDYGTDHSYQTYPLNVSAGLEIMTIAMDVGAGNAARIFGAIGKSATGGGILDRELNGEELQAGIQGFARGLLAAGGVDLIKQILSTTIRDNQRVQDVFDQAYQANYGELIAAVAFVLGANYGPLLRSRLGLLFDQLGSAVQQKLAGQSAQPQS
jgi:hypothetical protein